MLTQAIRLETPDQNQGMKACWFGAMTDIDNCYIGVLLRNLMFAVPANGTINEVTNYSRQLVPTEIKGLNVVAK